MATKKNDPNAKKVVKNSKKVEVKETKTNVTPKESAPHSAVDSMLRSESFEQLGSLFTEFFGTPSSKTQHRHAMNVPPTRSKPKDKPADESAEEATDATAASNGLTMPEYMRGIFAKLAVILGMISANHEQQSTMMGQVLAKLDILKDAYDELFKMIGADEIHNEIADMKAEIEDLSKTVNAWINDCELTDALEAAAEPSTAPTFQNCDIENVYCNGGVYHFAEPVDDDDDDEDDDDDDYDNAARHEEGLRAYHNLIDLVDATIDKLKINNRKPGQTRMRVVITNENDDDPVMNVVLFSIIRELSKHIRDAAWLYRLNYKQYRLSAILHDIESNAQHQYKYSETASKEDHTRFTGAYFDCGIESYESEEIAKTILYDLITVVGHAAHLAINGDPAEWNKFTGAEIDGHIEQSPNLAFEISKLACTAHVETYTLTEVTDEEEDDRPESKE